MPPPPAIQSVLCSECRVPFKDYIAYANHRTRKMRAGEGHIHCEDCGTEFTRPETLDRHRKQEHAHEQDLDCPACGAHFVRLGGLMAHIERGQCKIGADDIEHGRWVRSKMGRGLAELTGQDPKEYFGRFLGSWSDTLQPQSAVGPNKRLLGYIDTFTSGEAPSIMSYNGRASEVSNVRTEAQVAKPQHSHGSDLRFSDKTLFPTPAEASSSKGQGVKGKAVERVNVPGLCRRESDTDLAQRITKPPTSVKTGPSKDLPGSSKGKAPEGTNLSGVAHHVSNSGLLLDITELSTPVDAGPSKNPAKGSKREVPEGLNLPGVVQNASSANLGLGIMKFPSPVETGSSKQPTESRKAKSPESLNLQGGVTKHDSGASPGFLDTTLFPTLAEASKKQAKSKDQTDDRPTSVGVEEDEEEPPLKPPKSLGDSIWAPKKVSNMFSRPSQSGAVLLAPNAGNAMPIKPGGSSNAGCPPTSSEPRKVPAFESRDQKGPCFQSGQKNSAENAKVVVDQRDVGPIQCHPTQAREAPSERAEQPEITSPNPGVSPEIYGRAVPPHLRGKFPFAKTKENAQPMTAFENNQLAPPIPPHISEGIPRADVTEHCKAEVASADGQPTQGGDVPFRSPGLDTGLATSWADALKRENDTASVKHSDRGTIGTPMVSSRNGSGVPPHLRGNVGAIARVADEESSPNMDCYGDLPPHLQRVPGHASTIASVTTEAKASPALSMSDGQSTTKRTGSGSESEFDRRLHDNSGVVQTVKSYAVVTKSSAHIPPHLRVKQDGALASQSSREANKGDATQVEATLVEQKGLITRQTEDETDPPTQITSISEGIMEAGEVESGLGPHDPDHPQFDARTYYEQYSRRYLCPVPNCGKLFKSLQGITGHLASDVHRRPEMRLQCPHCLRKFKTTTALTQHAESQGRRCDIRNTTEFRPFIDQLTSGIADVEGVFEDQTNRYVVTEEAVYRYGDEEIRGRAIKALEEHQRREIGEKEGEYWVGKEIAW